MRLLQPGRDLDLPRLPSVAEPLRKLLPDGETDTV